MQHMIACENFDLTPAIREHVEANVETVTESLPRPQQVRTFLAHPGPREFTALMKVHAWNKEIVAKGSDQDLYKAISKARVTMLRRIHDIKDKKIQGRRGGESLGAIAAAEEEADATI